MKNNIAYISRGEKMNVVQRSYSIVSLLVSPLFFVSTMVQENQEARKEIPDQISEYFESEDNAEQEDWWYP